MNGAEQLYRVCWRDYGPAYEAAVLDNGVALPIGEATAEMRAYRTIAAEDNGYGFHMADYWLEPV